ncbi:MAG: MotA/TolQ/ExbB proton channel family protein [Pirellulaceae bacterium]|nr:MotA/TolQ/ExbB proton channel family protein [Pirellulaceae bacterium]
MYRQLSRVAVLLGLVALTMMSPLLATSAIAQNSADPVAANTGNEESVIATRDLFSVLRDGGPMLFLISMCSFVLCIFVFERSISLRRGRVIPKPFVKRFLLQLQEQQLKPEEALELCEENQSPVAQVFAAAVKKWGRPSVEVEQAVLDTGERVATGLRKYLRLFNGISTISPLLGLLGTVLGMITSFNSIASADAMGRPEMLAGGIAQALLTTAAGLTVAIPAIVAHLHFISRVDRLIIEIDDLGQQVVNSIASDGWRKPTVKKTARKTERKQAA